MDLPETSSNKSKQVAKMEKGKEKVKEEDHPCLIDRRLVNAVNHSQFQTIVLGMEAKIKQVMQDPKLQEVNFPRCNTAYLRDLAKALALHYGLEPHCTGGIRVFARKKPGSKIPTVTLSDLRKVNPEEKLTVLKGDLTMLNKTSSDRDSTNNLSSPEMTESANGMKTLEEREEYYKAKERIFSEPVGSSTTSPEIPTTLSPVIKSSVSPSDSCSISSNSAAFSCPISPVVLCPTSPGVPSSIFAGKSTSISARVASSISPVVSSSLSPVMTGSTSAMVSSSMSPVISSSLSPGQLSSLSSGLSSSIAAVMSSSISPMGSNSPSSLSAGSTSAAVSGSISPGVSSSVPSVVSTPVSPVHIGMFEESNQDGHSSTSVVRKPGKSPKAQPYYASGALYNLAEFSYWPWPQEQYMQYPQGQYMQYPQAQYTQHPQAQYMPYPQGQYMQHPPGQYMQYPQAQYTQHPQVQYTQHPQAQYMPYPQGQYMQHPPGQYTQYPQAQYMHCPPRQFMQYPQGQYTQYPQAQYMQCPPREYTQAQYKQCPPRQDKQCPPRAPRQDKQCPPRQYKQFSQREYTQAQYEKYCAYLRAQSFYPSKALYNPAHFGKWPWSPRQYTHHALVVDHVDPSYVQCPLILMESHYVNGVQYIMYCPGYIGPRDLEHTTETRPETAEQPINSNFQNNQNEVPLTRDA